MYNLCHQRDKMESEAANAKIENIHLYDEFIQRERATGDLVSKQQQSYDVYMKSKVAVEVIHATYGMHMHLGSNIIRSCLENDRYVYIF